MRKANAHMLAAAVALGMSGLGAGNQVAPIPELTPYTKSRPKKKKRTRAIKEGAEIMRKAQEKRDRKGGRRRLNQLARDVGQYEGWGERS